MAIPTTGFQHGNSTRKVVPPPGASAKPTLPVSRSTICFTMLRPRPVPPCPGASTWGGRKLDRIENKVGHDSGKPVRISSHVASRTRILKPNRYATALGKSLIGVDRLLDQRTNFDPREIEHDLPGFHLPYVENIVDQPYKSLAV